MTLRLLKAIMGSYGMFAMYNTILSNTYESQKENTVSRSDKEKNWTDKINRQLMDRENVYMNYATFCFGKCCLSVCTDNCDCAHKCKRRSKTHVDSANKLGKELDLLDFIRFRRITSFQNKMNLSKHQNYFINKFKSYSVQHEGEKHDSDESSVDENVLETTFYATQLEETEREQQVANMMKRLSTDNNRDS